MVGREGCYLSVNRVSFSALAKIEEEFEKRGLRTQVRFTYENVRESFIIMFMPGVAHDITAVEFSTLIRAKIARLPRHSLSSAVGVGTAEFGVAGQRRKQGDSGLKLAARVLADDWRSMIEVGYSQSLSSLRCDTTQWLVNSFGVTEIVIVIKISRDISSHHVERWQVVSKLTTRVTRSTQTLVPGALHTSEIHASGTVTPPGSQLTIPISSSLISPIRMAEILFSRPTAF